MRGKRIIMAAAVSALAWSGTPAGASTLIDHGTFTVDSATGLQWLDVSETLDRSYDDVKANFGNAGDVVYGYRYAGDAEVLKLVADAGVTSTLPCSGCSPGTDFVALADLLGPYSNGETYVYGLTGDNYGDFHYAALLTYYLGGASPYYYASIHVTPHEDGVSAADIGSFLVKDVAATPLPAALPLLASGLGALSLFGRRRKRKHV